MKLFPRLSILLLVVLSAIGCSKHEHADEAKAPEREGLSFTHFTDRT